MFSIHQNTQKIQLSPIASAENHQSIQDRTIPLLSIEDILSAPDPVYVISQMLQLGAVSLLYGESGTGKSFVSTDIALHAAHNM